MLERLERIEELERRQVPAEELLRELRGLVRDAEAWVRSEPDADTALGAVDRCRAALVQQVDREEVLLGQ